MDLYYCFPYTELHLGNICIESNGYITSSSSECRRAAVCMGKKMACFSTERYAYRPSDAIRWYTSSYCPENSKLFVAPSVKLPRDLYRNSGFQIVRDAEKADFCIIPSPVDTYYSFAANLVTYKEDGDKKIIKIWTCTSYFNRYTDEEKEEETKLLQAYFGSDTQMIRVDSNSNSKSYVEILPDIQEWKDLLSNTYPNRKYCLDTNVRVDYPTTINVETLAVWEKYNNKDLLRKAIVGSNWKDYPVTLCVFLSVVDPYIYAGGDTAFRYVMAQIGFYGAGLDNLLSGRIIQPNDWNMLQALLMHWLGVSERGGFATGETLSDYIYAAKRVCRRAICVTPVYIDQPLSYEHIHELITGK